MHLILPFVRDFGVGWEWPVLKTRSNLVVEELFSRTVHLTLSVDQDTVNTAVQIQY